MAHVVQDLVKMDGFIYPRTKSQKQVKSKQTGPQTAQNSDQGVWIHCSSRLGLVAELSGTPTRIGVSVITHFSIANFNGRQMASRVTLRFNICL